MIKKFDAESYKTAYNNIKLTESQKNTLITSAMNLKKSKKHETNNNSLYFFWTRVAACTLVAAIIFGCIFLCLKFNDPTNTFTITASAAELPESEMNSMVIGAFSDAGHSGFAMLDTDYVDENNPLHNGKCLNDQGKIDYISFYELTELSIIGKNIESVTFQANKKFTYFSFEPLNHTEKSPDELLEMFKNHDTIDNSQYSNEQGTGFFVTKGRCDSFTYDNPDVSEDEQIINLGSYFSFVIESDRTDEEIDEWVDKIEEAYSAYELVDDGSGAKKDINVSEKTDEELSNQLGKYVGMMCQKMLDNATIDVTVKFRDGSTQVKTLNVDIYQNTENAIYDTSEIVLSYAE